MGWNEWLDEPTTEFTDSQLEEHDAEIRADERAKLLDKLIDISHHCLVISELRSIMIDMRDSIK